jgi:hypothetical protein
VREAHNALDLASWEERSFVSFVKEVIVPSDYIMRLG